MDVDLFLELIEDPSVRAERYEEIINQWYDWATSNFQRTWGDRFHFAKFEGDETFDEAQRRQEDLLLKHLALQPGMRVLDLGSGLGGPTCYVAAHSDSHITGVDLSQRRVELSIEKAAKEGLTDRCKFIVGNVIDLPFEDACFDAVYSVEVGCYVPEKPAFYASAARVAKPGAVFSGWDWALTRKPTRQEQDEVVEPLLRYQAKANLLTTAEIRDQLEQHGFEIQFFEDLAETSSRPWWSEVSLRLEILPTRLMERASQEMKLLIKASRVLVTAGQEGLLTPLCFWTATRRA